MLERRRDIAVTSFTPTLEEEILLHVGRHTTVAESSHAQTVDGWKGTASRKTETALNPETYTA